MEEDKESVVFICAFMATLPYLNPPSPCPLQINLHNKAPNSPFIPLFKRDSFIICPIRQMIPPLSDLVICPLALAQNEKERGPVAIKIKLK